MNQRDDWLKDKTVSCFKDKSLIVQRKVRSMLNKTIKMFEYEDLPKTIPQKDLEFILQVGGFAILTKVNNELYAFRGGLGGEPNPYYLPTIATVSNPALKFSKTLTIGKECVVMLNDFLYQGTVPILSHYCELLTEAELTLRMAIINARVPALTEADNDAAYESARAFFSKIEEGTEYGIISSEIGEFFGGIKTHDFFKQHYITETIEAIQYIKGTMYNEIGVNAAFNMKREAINEAEATLNEDLLYPTVDSMLEMREKGLEEINDLYNTKISVHLSSVWEQNRKQDDLEFEMREAEIEAEESISKEGDEADEDD